MSRVRQNPLLAFLLHTTQLVLLREISYLNAENQILRSRLPKQIQTTPAERSLLVRLGAPLGNAIQELLSAVNYKTFLRWVREEKSGKMRAQKPRHPGRPPIVEETGWGYARIQGELKKLGITVATNTIKKILIQNGFHPSPNRVKGDWDRSSTRCMRATSLPRTCGPDSAK
ncbi:MAG: hypothetical protein ACFUZC_08550 [Chthoniobacteraceae bacterium]